MTAKDLKNALLQEAVQGKLVPQIASEGNARDLLEEIRKEKLSHGLDFANAKSGKRKSKKETALAGSNPCDITEDEIPFEIPESWCWCRLGEIAEIKSSKRVFEKDYVHEGVPFFRSKEIGDLSRGEGIHTELFITKKHYEELRCNYGVPQVEDILLTSVGSIGNYWICDGREFYYKDGNVTQICHNDFFETKYLTSFLSSPLFYEQVNSSVAGTAYNALTIIKLKSLLFPLPPLAEQKRIVAAIEKFMPLIEEYGKKESALKAINEQIGSLTKKAILQEAVQGKLVPQIDAEGNAKDLLEEIRKERLSHGFANSYGICSEKGKKSKSSDLRSKSQIRVTTEITEEEIPFDIPESWCWCRLGEIGDWKAGSTPSRSNPELYNGNIPWLKTGDLTDGDINEIPECISEKALESCSMRLNPIGSVLIAMYGATIGKLGILKIEATTNQACCACVPYNGIYNKYLFYYLMSQKKDFTEKAEGGAQPNISREKLVVHLIPLPPLAEQKRIVAAIEKMLPLCEKLGE